MSTLQLGTQAETVTVGAEAPLLEAEKADRGSVVPTRNLAELPIITRTPILLATLSPGVHATNPRYDLTPFSNSGLTTWSINGSTSLSTEFLLDGAPNSAVYRVEAERRLHPSCGCRAGAESHGRRVRRAVRTQWRRRHQHGGQKRHEPASRLRLRLPEATVAKRERVLEQLQGLPRDNNSLDEYGFSVGAPDRIPKVYNGKDKTFFFVAWEHYNQNILFPQNDISSVPTIAQRNGDFSQTFSAQGQLMPIYDPDYRTHGEWQLGARCFPGNIIPANRFDPVGKKIANLYPEPNTTTAGSVPWQNNFFLNDNVTWYDFNNFAPRIDHNFGAKAAPLRPLRVERPVAASELERPSGYRRRPPRRDTRSTTDSRLIRSPS